MANLLITSLCNRRCSFCFARGRLRDGGSGRDRPLHMTRDEIRKVMDLMERTDERDLRLLGGEPTLHPEFVNIVEEGLKRNFHVNVFTNGFMPRPVADFLGNVPQCKLSVLCNVSPQAVDPEPQRRLRDYSLDRLGERAALGITVTGADFDHGFLLDYIRRFKLNKNVRVGISQPMVGRENEYLHPSQYRAVGTAIANMCRACVKEDVLVGFDCGMTLCMFSESELGVLTTSGNGYVSVCSPIIDVGPGLNVWHCFPLAEVLVTNLTHFKKRKEIVSYYNRIMDPYRSLGCRVECLSCEYKRRRQCFGGCLAHAMNSLNKIPPRMAEEVADPSSIPDDLSRSSGEVPSVSPAAAGPGR